MPYIEKKLRQDTLIPNRIVTKGELEYYIFLLMKIYMNDKDYNYSNLHDATYSAQHCADEFRRRFLDKREDEARYKNGDINV